MDTMLMIRMVDRIAPLRSHDLENAALLLFMCMLGEKLNLIVLER